LLVDNVSVGCGADGKFYGVGVFVAVFAYALSGKRSMVGMARFQSTQQSPPSLPLLDEFLRFNIFLFEIHMAVFDFEGTNISIPVKPPSSGQPLRSYFYWRMRAYGVILNKWRILRIWHHAIERPVYLGREFANDLEVIHFSLEAVRFHEPRELRNGANALLAAGGTVRKWPTMIS
jgi:hypothetical protein